MAEDTSAPDRESMEFDVVVVGGGYIGLEAAAALTKAGCKVKVIEMMDRVMARAVAEPLSRFYEEQHRARGVEIMLNTGVTEFQGEGRVQAVIDSEGTAHECDLAIVGIGVIQDIELAETAGLETDGGIVVDERACTSDPLIFAAGDCTSHPNAILGRRLKLESVQNAVDQARCIANEWQGKGADYAEVPWFWSDQFDMKLQMAGLPDETDDVVVRGEPSMEGFSLFYLRGVTPPEVPTGAMYRGVIPFIVIQLLMLAMLAFWPGIATWLPAQIYAN